MFRARARLHFGGRTSGVWSNPSMSVACQILPTSNQAFGFSTSSDRLGFRSQARRSQVTLGKREIGTTWNGTKSSLGNALGSSKVFFPDVALRQIGPATNFWIPHLLRPRSMAGDSLPPLQSGIASGLALQFWKDSQREAYCALYHPFVVALASGSLRSGPYANYIAQDYYFLQAFAEAYTLAIGNVDGAIPRQTLTELRSHIQAELDEVHLSMKPADGQGLKLMEAEPNAATKAYTDFLLEVAKGKADVMHETAKLAPQNVRGSEVSSSSGQVAAYTIAAMTPCNRLYAFLGQEIMKSLKQNTRGHPFSQWIEMYASDNFAASALRCENLLDQLGTPLFDSVGAGIMRRLYRRAMDLEVAFFDAQLPPYSTGSLLVPVCRSLPSEVQFVLVSDFDSTCTASDSCPALAELSTCQNSQSFGETSGRRWAELVDEYTDGFTNLMTRMLEPQTKPGYNPEMVRRILQELSEFEIAANDRVVNAGVLAGMNAADVKRKGGSMQLREGCKELLERFSQADGHILSVCWSKTFVKGALSERGLDTFNIHCNELQFDSDGFSTGGMLRQVQTPLDKQRKFLEIVTSVRGGPLRVFSVYIGDSVTDLMCLLTADIGVVISPSKSLVRVAAACGISVVTLHSGLLQQQHREIASSSRTNEKQQGNGIWNKEEGVLYEISSWHELHAFLLGT